MKPRTPPSARTKRRTTLSLPEESLRQAERIARSKGVNLSVVVSEALAEGLRLHAAAERCDEVLAAYRQAFSSFSDEEMAILDGVALSPTRKK